MLVLTRKKDEQIRIGDQIIITVIRVKGKSVRLGIQAPRTEPVLRGELEFRDADDCPSEMASDAELCAAAVSEPSFADRRTRRPLRSFLDRGERAAGLDGPASSH